MDPSCPVHLHGDRLNGLTCGRGSAAVDDLDLLQQPARIKDQHSDLDKSKQKTTKALQGHYLKSDNNNKIFQYIFLFLCFILRIGEHDDLLVLG